MSIATKRGDDGTTSTAVGKRMLKCDFNIQTIGDIDELNCILGEINLSNKCSTTLHTIQDHLFRLGSDIACDYFDGDVTLLKKEHLDYIDNELIYYESILQPLKNFILPNNKLHTARAVCRRAERSYISYISKSNKQRPIIIIKYLNRLSDLLFQMARHNSSSEIIWKQNGIEFKNLS